MRLGSPYVVNPPWAHQTEALEFIAEKPGAMLAMDMGTGKTKAIIDIFGILLLRGLIFHVTLLFQVASVRRFPVSLSQRQPS